MNISLKNPFAAKPTTPPGPSATTADDALKGKQLLRGRTKAKVETLTADLDTAQRELAHARQVLGERMGDELDTTTAMEAMTQAESTVRMLEAALVVAREKDSAAQNKLEHAERQAVVALDDEANAAFKFCVMEVEGLLFGELKPCVDKVAAARLAVKARSGGDSLVASALIDFDAWFKVYLHRNCSALIPGGNAYSKILDEEKRSLSSWVDPVCYAMGRRRKG